MGEINKFKLQNSSDDIFSTPHMYNGNYKTLSDMAKESLESISTFQTELIKTSIKCMQDSINNLVEMALDCYSTSFKSVARQLSDLCNSTLLNQNFFVIPSETLDFLSEIDLQDNYIELTKENCDTLNTLFDLTGAENPLEPTPNSKIPMLQFVIPLFISIIFGILQLWQNENHHKQDSIEAQKAQVQEQEHYEQIMQSLSIIIDSLNECPEAHESLPCNCSDAPTPQDEASADMPDDQAHNGSAE